MNQTVRRVVIVGGGFAGLFAVRALGRAPVQVTLIDRAEHHLFQPLLYQCATGILSEGKIAAPLRELLRKAPQRRVRHRRGDGHRCGAAAGTGPPPAGQADRVRLRLPDPGRRRPAVLLRARRVRSGRARDEDHRGHDEDPAADLRRVRDGRVGRRPGRTGPLAHLRPGGRRADRRGAGRADPRGRDQDAAPRVPAHQAGGRPGPAVRRRERAAGDVRPEAVRPGRPRPGQARGRAAHGLDRHPRGRSTACRSRTTTAS